MMNPKATEHLNLVREAVRANDLGDYAEQITSLLRPSVMLATTRAEDTTIPSGASKLGGRPDVPESFEWPAWGGEPLRFVAQVNLADLAPFSLELPTDGLLSFFFCFETMQAQAGGTGQVFLFKDEALHRREPPHESEYRLSACSVRYISYPSLPPPYAGDLEELWGLTFLAEDDFGEAYAAVIDHIDAALGIDALSTPRGYNYHQLLGYPAPVQHTPIEIRLERERLRPKRAADETRQPALWEVFRDLVLSRKVPARVPELTEPERSVPFDFARCRDWRSLLMINEDEYAGIRLLDSGRLYFAYPGEQWAAGQFRDPWTMVDFG